MTGSRLAALALSLLAPPLAAPALATPTASAARLAPAEQKMAATVRAELPRTIETLAGWVDVNSGTYNLAGVRRVGDMVRAEFEPLGFKASWIDQTATKRAGHLILRHPGRGNAARLLLIGHLDTVFEPDSPFQRWRRDGDWGHGPGAGDDKGGIAVMLAALRAMKAAGTLRRADVTIVLTGDEEDSGAPLDLARAALIAEGKRADIALDFEGLSIVDGRDMGVVARRGATSWTLTTSATPSHSSGVFSDAAGYGAIYEQARILDAFRRELTDDKLTYNVGLVGGGQTAALDADPVRLSASGKTNIIAATAIARGDLRALTPQQLARTKDRMAAIVSRSLPGTRATLSFDDDGYPPMAPTAGNRALLARLNQVNADLGLPAQPELDPLKRGAGDISFVAADVDGLVGLGPASDGDHTDAERVNLPSIERQAIRAAILMSRLSR